RRRVEHARMHAKHRGHEAMHAEMVLILIATLVVAQLLLVQWKQRHPRSYNAAAVPPSRPASPLPSLPSRFPRASHRSGAAAASAAPPPRGPPRSLVPAGPPCRLVYKWFLLIYKLSYATGIVGYMAVMFTLFGLNLLFRIKPEDAMDFGISLLFYGLYYGVLERDFAEMCADYMASTIGVSPGLHHRGEPLKQLELPLLPKGSGVRASPPDGIPPPGFAQGSRAASNLLSFHEFCIRGWCIVGKKQTCPYCREKVDLRRMFSNPY
ncbi:RN121 protein, partial [Nothoprocta ornata]|nr:RN121 protein [Nothoprocta ornata]